MQAVRRMLLFPFACPCTLAAGDRVAKLMEEAAEVFAECRGEQVAVPALAEEICDVLVVLAGIMCDHGVSMEDMSEAMKRVTAKNESRGYLGGAKANGEAGEP